MISKLGNRARGRRYKTAGQSEAGARDVDTVTSAFQDLLSRVNRECNELNELYLEAEKRAVGSAQLTRTIVEHISSGIIVIESGGSVLLANSSARDLLRLGEEMDVKGRRLDSLFLDGRELEALAREDVKRGKGSSRCVIQVMTLDSRKRRLGVSTSCVLPGRGRHADALIMVFTVLGQSRDEESTLAEAEAERQGYLRGVLDSYDLMSGLLQGFGRIEDKAAEGSLTRAELADFSTCLRGACDTMMAFALSLEASSSSTEIVDVNCLIDSILRRRAIPRTSIAKVDLHPGLSRVKTVRKVLETGLELLIAGCTEESAAGIAIRTGPGGENGRAVEIFISELGLTRPILQVNHSLRELMKGKNLRREAGMYLLASLPLEGHLTDVRKVDGLFNFSVKLLTPIKSKAGKSQHKGDSIERTE
jgi:PAS domain-containing protein